MNEHAFWKSCEETQFSSKYYLKKLLGVGGFGAVYRADEVVADRCIRTVALKIFNPFQTPNLDAFIQEFQTTANLRHPHLIETYAVEEGKLQGAIASLGLVMELAGEDLARRLERSLLTVAETRSLVQQVAEALKFLHSKGIVHRDIKPHNIMAVGSGADLTWKVGDLGIVRVIGNQTATMTTNRQGSPFYVPPEAYSGEVSPAMDLWALGVTITQVLTGQVPFPGPSEAEVVNQVLNQEPVLPQMEDTLAAIVRGCLVKDRKKRWTPSQVLEALSPQRSNPTDTWWDLDAVPLESEKEMDYTTLRDLLKTEQWKRADQETSRIFCQLTPWNRDGYLTIEDIQQLPCTDLITIDKLWNTASRGFYGFSVQKEIYINCGGSLSDKYPGDRVWHKFCQQIGWRINHRWLLYKNLNFRHPKHHGHFPRGRLGKRKWQRFFAIISRFAKCSP